MGFLANSIFFSTDPATARPELQRILDGLVTDRGHVAPGVTAYVSGPNGSWVGSAGYVLEHEDRPADARRCADAAGQREQGVDSTLILQLVGEGRMRLDDTVERWLPGLLPFASQITVRELLNHSSGLIDNNDIGRAPATFLAQVRDPVLRARLVQVKRRWGGRSGASLPGEALGRVRGLGRFCLRPAPSTTIRTSATRSPD